MSVDAANQAFERREWSRAYEEFHAADEAERLTADELGRFGLAAQLRGFEADGARLWERAHRAYLDGGDPAGAALAAFWLGMAHNEQGEVAQARGWLSRASRIVEEERIDGPVAGYLRIPEGLQLLGAGEPARALEAFREAEARGRRFAATELITLGRLGVGQALNRLGRTSEGTALLDEVMVSVMSDELSPLVSGIVYCAVIDACFEIFDVGRAREWTDALARWCDSQPDLVPFRGVCQVRRSEISQLHGDWRQAMQMADEAERTLAGPPRHPAIGAAYYQQGELHRLRGAFGDADDAYRNAEQSGHSPEPGRSLLRLAQGRIPAAVNAIQHALDEVDNRPARIRLLVAAAEIHCAASDVTAAKRDVEQLSQLAEESGAAWVRAEADRARGALAVACESPGESVTVLRASLSAWQQMDAPYEAARTRQLLGNALKAAGEVDEGNRQVTMARDVFSRLGAITDIAGSSETGAGGPALSVLTAREIEVLRLVATGMTNRAIASNLTISEKTVANHVGNILGKLELSSRAAATAFAYEHGLA
ncbi:MAG: LuxR C-terminal-related transcriptional regulator [Dehalococcoidia bacterium]